MTPHSQQQTSSKLFLRQLRQEPLAATATVQQGLQLLKNKESYILSEAIILMSLHEMKTLLLGLSENPVSMAYDM
jgi:hypothetical protein